jgi:toxin ParE1/3/4
VSGRRYNVIWTEPATRDVERLAAYLSADSPMRAEEILERIVSRAQSPQSSPERGRTPPELRSIGDRTWREIQETPWRIVYRIAGRRIEIHAVFDGRRDLEDVLLERILGS